MKAETKLAKCAGCLPDAKGAYFTSEYANEGRVWVCNNCGHKVPRRKNNPTPKVTPTQQEVIDLLVSMGWEITKQEFIGRNLWIEAKCANQWYNGDKCYGSITPRGTYKLRATSFGNPPVITDRCGIAVYLAVRN